MHTAPNVLLLTGYWPVLGPSIAAVTSGGETGLIVPEDECSLASSVSRSEILPYSPGSLQTLQSASEFARAPLEKVARSLNLNRSCRIGLEQVIGTFPSPDAAARVFAPQLRHLAREVIPEANWTVADCLLEGQRSTLTSTELQNVRSACEIAAVAFSNARKSIRPGATEWAVAMSLQGALGPSSNAQRRGGNAWCRSGPNSALAGAAFQETTDRRLRIGDLVLVHCNSYVNCYRTDIT